MELRKQLGRDWPENAASTRNIVAPVAHEGVGNALRSAYGRHVRELPEDMADLLAKLG